MLEDNGTTVKIDKPNRFYVPRRPLSLSERLDHMVQDLSSGSCEGGAGCCAAPVLGTAFTGLGRRAGGLSCTPMRGATAGLKVLMVSLEELVLRRMADSPPAGRSRRPCSWLRDSVELVGVGAFFICSRVSSTTSGACLAELWRSSSFSSFRAVFMVSSMSYGTEMKREISNGKHRNKNKSKVF